MKRQRIVKRNKKSINLKRRIEEKRKEMNEIKQQIKTHKSLRCPVSVSLQMVEWQQLWE
jgi:uncharacterized OsmC-like protein